MSEPFIGEIRMWACDFAPRGWAYCHGQTLMIGEHTALFAVIGTRFGGNGRTNFMLPDLQCRAPLNKGMAPGLSDYPMGKMDGQTGVTLFEPQLPGHTHTISAQNKVGNSASPANDKFAAKDASPISNLYFLKSQDGNVKMDSTMSGSMLAAAGNSLPHENRQPYLGTHFCIAIDGLFPARN